MSLKIISYILQEKKCLFIPLKKVRRTFLIRTCPTIKKTSNTVKNKIKKIIRNSSVEAVSTIMNSLEILDMFNFAFLANSVLCDL